VDLDVHVHVHVDVDVDGFCSFPHLGARPNNL
jgi:hypothetical protein